MLLWLKARSLGISVISASMALLWVRTPLYCLQPCPQQSERTGTDLGLQVQQLFTRRLPSTLKMSRWSWVEICGCFALQLHTEQTQCQQQQGRPSCSLAAVSTFARFLSCKFHSFLHWTINQVFFFFFFLSVCGARICVFCILKKSWGTLCLITFRYFKILAASLTMWSRKEQRASKVIWRKISSSMCKTWL